MFPQMTLDMTDPSLDPVMHKGLSSYQFMSQASVPPCRVETAMATQKVGEREGGLGKLR